MSYVMHHEVFNNELRFDKDKLQDVDENLDYVNGVVDYVHYLQVEVVISDVPDHIVIINVL